MWNFKLIQKNVEVSPLKIFGADIQIFGHFLTRFYNNSAYFNRIPQKKSITTQQTPTKHPQEPPQKSKSIKNQISLLKLKLNFCIRRANGNFCIINYKKYFFSIFIIIITHSRSFSCYRISTVYTANV